MKKYFVAFVFLIMIFLPLSAQTGNKNSGGDKSEFEIPAAFFDQMFRAPSDDFLVAWHAGVKIALMDSKGGTSTYSGSILPLEKFLNEGYNELFNSYFNFSMKDGKKQIVSPDEKVWAARCGLKSTRNINISTATGKEIKAFPAEITAEPWSKSFTVKRTYVDSESNQKIVEIYRLEATSIYYYDKSENGLKGSVKRDDGYQLCGKMLFQRRGPGLGGTVVEETNIENEKFHFEKVLHRGDYQVSFMWPHGGRIILDEDFVYNPTDSKMTPEFTISAFTGHVKSRVVYKDSDVPVKNYHVKIVPICPVSGLPEKETKTDENGDYHFNNIPAGEYYIVVHGSENRLALVTKNGITAKPKDSEISVNYDIYAYYNAPGFVKAGVVWRNTTIRFPDKNNPPQVFDVMAYERAGGTGEPKGTDGKPLNVPFSMIVPMIGKQTLYSRPEDEYETPELLYAKSLGYLHVFRLNKKQDALNSCHIVRTNGGSIHLELGIDLNGVNGDVKMQYAIHSTNNTLRYINITSFPTNFKAIRFSKEDIEQFKKFEKVEKMLSNGKATLKVEFMPN